MARTVRRVATLLDLSTNLPEVEFAAGEAVVREGNPSGPIWILVSGSLRVLKGDVQVNTITEPGAAVGEISVLLGSDHGATVEALETSRLRQAADGHGFLESDPAVAKLIAAGLAERLNFVSRYLADLEHQYGDAPGLSMVSDVIGHLAQHHVAPARPGSARDPHPEY
jgi:CRP/FNR family cyclic AMP-dependent transcriptional regulator